MKTQNKDFTRLMRKLNIHPAKTEAEKFYDWLIKLGNIHTADNKQMQTAFTKIIN
jgi:hypothetical protein